VAGQAPGARAPLAALSRPVPPGIVSSGQTAFPAVATAAAAQLIGTGPATISLGQDSTVTIQLTGQVGGVPGVAAGAVVLVPSQALRPAPLSPNLLLVSGPGLDAARLTAAVHRLLPGAAVTLRATALTALTSAPVLQAARAALTQAAAAAAGFGVLVLLLSLLLTARTRDMTLARLATMGLRRWQAQLVLAAEALPPVVAAAAGGVACAWLLAPLIGPSLNLAAFSGTPAAIAVTPAAAPLAGAAAALVLAALLVLAAEAVLAYQRGSTRALRITD
jgi:putative ABC transport system permease protein